MRIVSRIKLGRFVNKEYPFLGMKLLERNMESILRAFIKVFFCMLGFSRECYHCDGSSVTSRIIRLAIFYSRYTVFLKEYILKKGKIELIISWYEKLKWKKIFLQSFTFTKNLLSENLGQDLDI